MFLENIAENIGFCPQRGVGSGDASRFQEECVYSQ